jgi:hypothetical protein
MFCWIAAFFLFVGTLAAEELPSLPALGDIEAATIGNGDPTFAGKLEELGDTSGALLEWQRIAHAASGAAEAHALLAVARLALVNGQKNQAQRTMERFIGKFGKHPRLPEALSYLSRAVPVEERQSVLNLMQRLAPTSDWTKEAIYHAVWDHARRTGTLPQQDYEDPRAQQLLRRMDDLASYYPGPVTMAILALLPGSTHLWYGEFLKGGLLLLGTFALLWALIYALQQRHWPYATVWTLTLFSLATLALRDVQSLADLVQTQDRFSAMDSWTGLYPSSPNEKKI